MSGTELALVQSLKDAVALLRWQANTPISAGSWGEWVVSAMTLVDEVSNAGRPAIQGDIL